RSIAVIAAALALWASVCRAAHVSRAILPPPSQVARKWWEYLITGELPRDAVATLLRVFVGFAIGAGLALPLGLWMGARHRVYELFNPIVQLLRPIPPIAFIPLAILWFGLGNPPAFFLISLGAFFPVLMNTIAGVRSVDAIYVRAAQNLGAPARTLFWRVRLPGAMPSILSGVRVGIGVATSGVRKECGSIVALDRIDLDVAAGEFVCLLGPSGCGKSTLLNAIAGFTRPSAGEILAFGKRVVQPEPARAMVFQEYALFPWMTVRENVSFGLQIRGDRGACEKADALLDKLALRGFGDRYPKDLSGGM